jgi:ketosteroid isomerase-like protein
MRHPGSLSVLLVVIALSRAAAQSISPAVPPADQLKKASDLFARGAWGEALSAYESIANTYPKHALSRFRIGVALLELGKLADAETSLRQGEALGMPPGQAAFRLAQLYGLQHKADSAISELERAATQGIPATPQSLQTDPHLASLTSDPRWRDVLDAFDAVVQPCKHDRHFRDFDFWVGDWDVRPTGQSTVGPPARNTVTADDNGCVVTEHWKAPSGSEGQSFNIYDRSYGEWRQTWVDNAGGQHDYRGQLRGKDMVFLGDTPAPGGRRGRVPTRLSFFNLGPDSVRQFSETSADSGKTWQVSYDLMYVRRKSEALVGAPSAPAASALTERDRSTIRSLDSSFVRAWLQDDTSAVLALFASDAVLLPPGAAPVVGLPAIRTWWWPTDGSHTRIRSFDRTVVEIGGTRDLAFLRSTSGLRWDLTKDGKTDSQTSHSTDLVLVAPDANGRWHIVRQMWNPLK